MMKIGGRTMGIALSLCALAGAASAQMPQTPAPQPQSHEHAIRIGLGGGMSVPVSHAGDELKTGVHGQGFLLMNLGRLLHLGALPTVRLNFGYQQFNYKDEFTGAQSGSSAALQNAESKILSGVAGFQINLLHGPVRPYLLAGLGAYRIQNSVDSTGTSTDASTSSTKFGVDGGAGLAFTLGRIDAYVEGKVQNVYSDQGLIDTKSIRVIPVSFGIVF